MSVVLICSFIVMLPFAVWAVVVVIRWQPERGVDANWYESGIGRHAVGGHRGFTN